MPRPTKSQAAAEAAERFRERREELALFAESPRPRLENPIRLISDDVLAMFDIHQPFVDADFCSRAVSLAKAWHIENCILGGDLFDMSVFSKFGANPQETLEEELSIVEAFLEVLCRSFVRVLFLLGNHELRLLGKMLNRQLSVSRFIRLFTPQGVENFYATNFEWIEMESQASGIWLFAHPANSSVIAGRVPSIIAGRSAQGKHVVSGHGHLAAILRNDAGTHWVIDSGCCADPRRIEYSTVRKSNRPVMVEGCVLIKSGFPTLAMPSSDWLALQRMYEDVPACQSELIMASAS